MTLIPDSPRPHPFAHWLLVISLIIKGALGFGQLLAGALLFAMPGALGMLAKWLARTEPTAGRSDPFALWMAQQINALPIGEERFFAVYFVIHGILNLGAVLALLAGLRWAYPLSIWALVGFIVYQMYKYAHGEGPIMLVLSAIDIVVIWLIWIEYRAIPGKDSPQAAARSPL